MMRPALLAKIAATVLVVGGGVGWALYSTSGTAFQYYKHVDEITHSLAQWRGKPLDLHGFVMPGSIQRRLDREKQQQEYKFLVINCGEHVEVTYAGGIVPDTFKDGAEVVCKGSFDDGSDVFHSTEIMAKCPSKYQMSPAARTMCAKGQGN